LDEPVAHVRDVRSELLVKLALLHRSGRDHTALVDRQRQVVDVLVGALVRQARAARRAGGIDAVVIRWRLESARAVRRFLDALD
jgi:PadR family transcriptional regulator AphA